MVREPISIPKIFGIPDYPFKHPYSTAILRKFKYTLNKIGDFI